MHQWGEVVSVRADPAFMVKRFCPLKMDCRRGMTLKLGFLLSTKQNETLYKGLPIYLLTLGLPYICIPYKHDLLCQNCIVLRKHNDLL